MKRDLKELIQELLDHIDENPLTDEQIEKIEKCLAFFMTSVYYIINSLHCIY